MRPFILSCLFLSSCSAAPTLQSTSLPKYAHTWHATTIPNPQAKATLLFYPGGLVQPRAYLPILGELSKQAQVEVIIAHMPFDLAVLNPDRTELLKNAQDTVFIGGHSLGGAMAAEMIQKYPQRFNGLLLWAAYPADSNNLSSSSVPIISLSGTKDGLSTPQKIEAAKSLLPNNTQYNAIKGGNHAQFAHYGKQKGDGLATLSRESQQEEIIQYSTAFIQAQLQK